MSQARFIVGDVFDVLSTLEDGSVDLVLTSPPFLALRSYLPADHPDKAKELGSEPTPEAFIDTLLDLTEEWARVLAPHGSLCVELGDTYGGSGGAGGDYNDGGLRDGQDKFDGSARRSRPEKGIPGVMSPGGTLGTKSVPTKGSGWPLAKSLCLIPESYRWALVYGRNPFNGRVTEPWRARNVIRWCRPNPPVGALGDKVRPATSDMVVACKSGQRWFDLDAVRNDDQRAPSVRVPEPKALAAESLGHHGKGMPATGDYHANGGSPPLDHWWHDELPQDAWWISTEPYSGSHYATWPRELCVKPVESMCPRRVCRQCGKPSERIIESERLHRGKPVRDTGGIGRSMVAQVPTSSIADVVGMNGQNTWTEYKTVGWSDCGHDDWRPGVVLDPFAGSGTTLAVATGHGRDAIGIDLDERNADLARERVGMFLDVEYADRMIDVRTGGRL